MEHINHTFAVCAYKESGYLEDCLRSLESQRRRSEIIICTSTPNRHIEEAARRHGLPLYVGPGGGIAADWNFAYSCASTKYVTLAHQDDIYDEDFSRLMLEGLERSPDTIIGFTDYYEIRNGEKVYADQYLNLRIKKLLLLPLRSRLLQKSRWVRRRVISVGDPICCPSVTYAKDKLPEAPFPDRFKVVLDWHTWEILSRQKGRFLYVDTPLMGHRIHRDSTSAGMIGADRGRRHEDLEMLKMFWPQPVAKLINCFYSLSQRGNGSVAQAGERKPGDA